MIPTPVRPHPNLPDIMICHRGSLAWTGPLPDPERSLLVARQPTQATTPVFRSGTGCLFFDE